MQTVFFSNKQTCNYATNDEVAKQFEDCTVKKPNLKETSNKPIKIGQIFIANFGAFNPQYEQTDRKQGQDS